MRPLATRRITALAISAVISLGAAGPALADAPHPSVTTDRGVRAPVPDGTDLAAEAEELGDLTGVLTPVSELVAAALKADAGRPPAVDVEAFRAKVAAFVEEAESAARLPLPDLPVTSPAAGADRAAAPADLVGDALATVEKAVAGLLAAVGSGDTAGAVPQVTATLTALVDTVLGTLLGGGLPAAPTLPVPAPELPVPAPELPVDAPVAPPAGVPELPVAPRLPVG
ncbi:hypothetical protein ACIQ9R_08315 [Streptomyces sp. NPDC094447]|uniref:hypothetical protein n=1 Tax=Streptomyces sp. NPDC094447 TaxID=3366062 RepID=UPI003816758B